VYLRLILFAVLAFLLVRLFRQLFNNGDNSDDNNINKPSGGKKVSEDTGEYVDYEEIKD
jgi:hypothetical protein